MVQQTQSYFLNQFLKMQSKDLKILNLINSPDKDTSDLGYLTLNGILTKENVIYWYLTLCGNLVNIPEKTINKFEELVDWTFSHTHVNYKKCALHIAENKGDLKSMMMLMKHQNNMLLSIMTQRMSPEESINCKKELSHVNFTTTKFD